MIGAKALCRNGNTLQLATHAQCRAASRWSGAWAAAAVIAPAVVERLRTALVMRVAADLRVLVIVVGIVDRDRVVPSQGALPGNIYTGYGVLCE
jgi:hypothetical protein